MDQTLADLPVRGGALGLYGPCGLGRSAMLHYAAARASESGFAVLRAAGSSNESEVAYAALNQVLQPVYPHVARLPQRVTDALYGVVDPPGGPCAPEEVAVSLARVTQRLSSQRPLLVLVDDAELTDAMSTAVLLNLFSRQWQPGCSLIVAGQDQARAGGWETIPAHTLQALAPSLSRILVTRSYPDLPPSSVGAVVSSSGGYPLVLRELALEPASTLQVRPSGRRRSAAGPGTAEGTVCRSMRGALPAGEA